MQTMKENNNGKNGKELILEDLKENDPLMHELVIRGRVSDVLIEFLNDEYKMDGKLNRKITGWICNDDEISDEVTERIKQQLWTDY